MTLKYLYSRRYLAVEHCSAIMPTPHSRRETVGRTGLRVAVTALDATLCAIAQSPASLVLLYEFALRYTETPSHVRVVRFKTQDGGLVSEVHLSSPKVGEAGS